MHGDLLERDFTGEEALSAGWGVTVPRKGKVHNIWIFRIEFRKNNINFF